MEIFIQRYILSEHEHADFIEIKMRHRLMYFSYTYWFKDKSGNVRPIVRWDNFGGQIHYDAYDTNQQLFKQQNCEYKDPREVIRLITIFRQNLANMDLNKL